MKLVYFASVRESIGCGGEERALPAHIESVADTLDWLAEEDERYARAFANRAKLRFALDQQMAKPGTPLSGAKELAIFPPVTGG